MCTPANGKTPDQTHPFHVSGACSRFTPQRCSDPQPFEEGLTVNQQVYQQNYDPFGNVFLSTVTAAVPIAVLLYFIALHPHRDKQGQRHLGISAPYAAFLGVIAAFLVSCLAFRMPVGSAVSAFALGSLSGFVGIIWIVVAAMLLYTMTVVTGKFEIVKSRSSTSRSIAGCRSCSSRSRSARSSRGPRVRDPGGDRRRHHGRPGVQAVPGRGAEPHRQHRPGRVSARSGRRS